MKKIAIIGRPNVGKSTLFNRFAGRRLALVHDKPGMTRDRRETDGRLYDLNFKIVDTAGLADPDNSELTKAMLKQTQHAIDEADLIIFVIDAREGCTPYDHELASLLRRQKKPIIMLANKCEGYHGDAGYAEANRLGLGNVIPISAEHGLGLADIYEAMAPYFADELEAQALAEEALEAQIGLDITKTISQRKMDKKKREAAGEKPKNPLQLAIVGRPNVGKSTLINKLIGEERLITADMPGVTRDAISLDWEYQGRAIKIIDTAGIRRRSRASDPAERLSIMDTDRSIQFAEVVVLIVDATAPFEKQDLTLAYDVFEEGRAFVLALNKWDLVKDKKGLLSKIEQTLQDQLAQARGIPCIPICARSGQNLDKLMEAVGDIYDLWNKRIPTAKLNKWLEYVTEAHPAPMVKGRRIRLKYMTQIKTRPPTFAVFASQADELPDSYRRYLINQLRKDFDMDGVPIRVMVKGTTNPYDKK